MTFASQLNAAWRLTRPGQWPILTAQFLLAVMLVSPRAAGGGCWLNLGSLVVLACSWLVWVVLLNGGTLAFNSAYDRDTGPVAYLPEPPEPPAWLGGAAAAVMAGGAVLGWLVVGHAFGLVTAVCVILSLLYSHPSVRLKGKPGLDLLTNMIGYGAGTTVAGVLAGAAAYLGHPIGTCDPAGVGFFSLGGLDLPALSGTVSQQFTGGLAGGKGWLAVGFGLLFGSFYPTTQIYQVTDDLNRGDRTLTTALGVDRALLLAIVLGLLAGGSFVQAWVAAGPHWSLLLPAVAVAVWVVHLAVWKRQAGDMDDACHQDHMYTALKLWAAVDAALLLGWFLRP
jgi:4-hydroxybenzoate polyprenyltransferase